MEGDSVWYKGKNSFKGRSRPDFPPPSRSWNHHGQVASPDGFRLQNGADYPPGCCYRRTHSSPQNTERYASPAGWSCGCRQAPALHSPSQWPSPLWCHSWWQFIFISSSLKKKKMWQLLNLNPPKQAFFSPVYLPVLPEKIILKEQFPLTVSWRERAWGSPSVCSKRGDRTFQRHDPDSGAPHGEVAIGRHFIPCKRTRT